MPKIVKHSLISLVLINIGAFSLAHASTVQIQCHPIPYLNAASISATVNISNEVLPDNSVKASASFNATLKRQINGSVPFTLNSQVSGRVVSSVTQDAQGNTQYFKTFYAVSKGLHCECNLLLVLIPASLPTRLFKQKMATTIKPNAA